MAGVHLSLPLGLLLLMSCAGGDEGDASRRQGPPRFGSSDRGGSAGMAADPAGGDTQTPATPTSGLGGSEATPVVTGLDPTVASGGAGAQLGTGGTQVGGAAGNAAAGAAGTSSEQPPSPVGSSAGCGRIAPPSGELALQLGGTDAAYTVTLPPNYDPEVPSPLIFAFHGR